MEDISGLKTALTELANDSINTRKSDGDSNETHVSFLEMVAAKLHGSPVERRAAIEVLQDILKERNDEDKAIILEDSALLLLPPLVAATGVLAETTLPLCSSIARYARPKEVILALNEGIALIAEKATRAELSDDEEELDESTEQEDNELEQVAIQLDEVLDLYLGAIHKLRVVRSTSTVLSISEAISTALRAIVPQTGVVIARRIATYWYLLIKDLWLLSESTSDAGGEQRAILRDLMLLGVTLLGPRVDAELARKYFVSEFPQYGPQPPLPQPWEARTKYDQDVKDTNDILLWTSDRLGLTPTVLLDRIIHPSTTSPHSPLGSLILLSTYLNFKSIYPSETMDLVFPEVVPLPSVEDCMPVLSAALGGTAIDAGLALLWHLMHRKQEVISDNATLLLELLVPLAAMSPNPLSRLMVFKLFGAIISAVQGSHDQILLYKQLLEPANPFDLIRVQSLSLLREAISVNKNILSPCLLAELGPILFQLPTTSAPDSAFLQHTSENANSPPLDLPPSELLSTMYPSWFTECANLLRLIILQDTFNHSGVREPALLSGLRKAWIEPQERKLDQIRGEDLQTENAFGASFVVDRWADSLQRLKETISSIHQ